MSKLGFLGDARFIGVAAAEAALAAGHDVTILHSGKYPPALAGANYRVMPSDASSQRTLASELALDTLVDTHAMREKDAHLAIAAFRGLVPRVVLLSSQDVYAQFGHLLGHPSDALEGVITEASALTVPFPFRGIAQHPAGEDYDKKLVEAAYQAAASSFESITILRLPAVYGPRDTKRRFAFIVDALDKGRTQLLRKGGAWRWTHGYIKDVAAAIVAASTRDTTSKEICTILNAGDRTTPTMSQWAELLAKSIGVDLQWQEVENVPEAFSYLGPMPCDFVVDAGRCWSTLGIRATPLEERLERTVHWLRSSRS